MTQTKPTLSKVRIKQWVQQKMARGRWIDVSSIPHLKPENYNEFVDVIKEMIDNREYGDQKIFIELDKLHISVKIFET